MSKLEDIRAKLVDYRLGRLKSWLAWDEDIATLLSTLVKTREKLNEANERIRDITSTFGEDYDGLTELEALRSDHRFYEQIKEALGMSHVGNPAMVLWRVKEIVAKLKESANG